MLGGNNIQPMIDLLDEHKLAEIAGAGVNKSLWCFL
ncbi:hypothetical protein DXX93_16735 [Thalassotalea euphylliae]|uniref:Uncharacterized protein n=1 Tax=Thalassotalea euphylliae TaxID=1655234 RepID=A0A3E0TUD0_9GAMM|nr:hypothetical protein DXX93_16735 [Thalassotalea euphylliae]